MSYLVTITFTDGARFSAQANEVDPSEQHVLGLVGDNEYSVIPWRVIKYVTVEETE